MQNSVNRINFLVWRCMEHNDDGPYQTYGAANFAQNAQVLVQEV